MLTSKSQAFFAYNGMLKDDEIQGVGNSYTTEFRMLDPRLGRWWSIDPVVKHDLSPYISMSDNPIIKVDPTGDDDYFNADGSYNHEMSKQHNKDGHNIYVLSSDGKQKTLLAKMPLNNVNDRKIVEKIINLYAHKAGIKNGVKLEYRKDKKSKVNPAYTTFLNGKKITYLNYNGGIDSDLSNYHNLIEVFNHEKIHQNNPEGHSNDDLFIGIIQHMDVYMEHMEKDNFKRTSEHYKLTSVGTYAYYLSKAQDNAYDEEDKAKVEEYRKEFNNNIGKKFGYEIIHEETYIYNTGEVLHTFSVEKIKK
jgi:RHS repeat-associated protein